MLSQLNMIDMHSDTYRNNPYPYFQKMRAEYPIFPLRQEGCWAISRYNDVKKILKNHELFSSTDIVKEPNVLEPSFLFHTRGMVGADKPEHTRLRQLLHKIFPQYKINYLEPIIRQSCHQLLSGIKNKTLADIVNDLSAPLPIMVITKLLGIDTEKTEEFRHCVLILLTWRSHHYPDKEACIHSMFHYLTEIIKKRRIMPESDMISALVLASENDNTITKEEVLAFIRLLLVGGTDTTTNLLGNALHILLNNPEFILLLQEEPQKIDAFIEETLRYDGPVLSLCRRVTQDIEFDGVTFKKNNLIFPLIASANHDETIFSNPENFEMQRDAKAHLSFGSGIHHCFSSQLARLQVRIAFEEILNAWNFIEHADNKPLSFIESFFFRGFKSLPIKISWK